MQQHIYACAMLGSLYTGSPRTSYTLHAFASRNCHESQAPQCRPLAKHGQQLWWRQRACLPHTCTIQSMRCIVSSVINNLICVAKLVVRSSRNGILKAYCDTPSAAFTDTGSGITPAQMQCLGLCKRAPQAHCSTGKQPSEVFNRGSRSPDAEAWAHKHCCFGGGSAHGRNLQHAMSVRSPLSSFTLK